MIDDYVVACSDWGFSPAEVEAEVHLWHGVRDPLVPIEHALQLAITLRRCRVFFDPDEGHHFFRSRLRTILAVLIGCDAHAGPDDVAGPRPHDGWKPRRDAPAPSAAVTTQADEGRCGGVQAPGAGDQLKRPLIS